MLDRQMLPREIDSYIMAKQENSLYEGYSGLCSEPAKDESLRPRLGSMTDEEIGQVLAQQYEAVQNVPPEEWQVDHACSVIAKVLGVRPRRSRAVGRVLRGGIPFVCFEQRQVQVVIGYGEGNEVLLPGHRVSSLRQDVSQLPRLSLDLIVEQLVSDGRLVVPRKEDLLKKKATVGGYDARVGLRGKFLKRK